MGCESRDQTIERALRFVYFKNMNTVFDVMRLRCNSCQRVNKPNKPNKFQLILHHYVKLWFILALNHVGPLNPIIDGKRYILTVKYLFTGWVQIFPDRDTKTGPVIKALPNELFICQSGALDHSATSTCLTKKGNLFNMLLWKLPSKFVEITGKNFSSNWCKS